jgi:hypothetical protein
MRWSWLAIFITGCGASYELSEATRAPVDAFGSAPSDKALVCVLRPSELGSALTVAVSDNGQVVGATRGPSYFCYLSEPGYHQLSVDGSDADDVELVTLAGQRHYLELRINFGQDELVPTHETFARPLVAHLDYLLIEEGPDGEAPPPTVPVAPASRCSAGGLACTR